MLQRWHQGRNAGVSGLLPVTVWSVRRGCHLHVDVHLLPDKPVQLSVSLSMLVLHSTSAGWPCTYSTTMSGFYRTKKKRFDPLTQRAKFRVRHTLVDQISETGQAFISAVREALTSNELNSVLSSLDLQTRELVLVASLGLEGVECVRVASQLVPHQFPERDRLGYVTDILKTISPLD